MKSQAKAESDETRTGAAASAIITASDASDATVTVISTTP